MTGWIDKICPPTYIPPDQFIPSFEEKGGSTKIPKVLDYWVEKRPKKILFKNYDYATIYMDHVCFGSNYEQIIKHKFFTIHVGRFAFLKVPKQKVQEFMDNLVVHYIYIRTLEPLVYENIRTSKPWND